MTPKREASLSGYDSGRNPGRAIRPAQRESDVFDAVIVMDTERSSRQASLRQPGGTYVDCGRERVAAFAISWIWTETRTIPASGPSRPSSTPTARLGLRGPPHPRPRRRSRPMRAGEAVSDGTRVRAGLGGCPVVRIARHAPLKVRRAIAAWAERRPSSASSPLPR